MTTLDSTQFESAVLADLDARIRTKEARIGVIGLGYVGLPVAAMLAQAGFAVTGIDILAERVERISRGENPIEGDEPGLAELMAEVVGQGRLGASTDYAQLHDADIVLINVETPVDEQHVPRYHALRAVCRSLGPVLKKGALVIVESTIAPGTIDRLVVPILAESSGGRLNEDFFVGACPERVMPGKLLQNIRSMSRVCGGSTPETAACMVSLYRHIVEAELDVADPVTAEIVKTAENAYRDVQIAFANEVALICEVAGADVWRVRELVNKSPSRNMHLPGAGVGGHCIPKDGWLLAHGAAGAVTPHLIAAARAVNEGMPGHMMALAAAALAEHGMALRGATVALLGYSYLEDSDDTRHSPTAALVPLLESQGAAVRIHDPWVAEYRQPLADVVTGCDAAILMVRHKAYHDLDLAMLCRWLRTPVLVDGRHLFERGSAEAAGLTFRAVGLG